MNLDKMVTERAWKFFIYITIGCYLFCFMNIKNLKELGSFSNIEIVFWGLFVGFMPTFIATYHSLNDHENSLSGLKEGELPDSCIKTCDFTKI